MDAKPGQFIRGRPANPARPARDEGIQRIGSHLQFPVEISIRS
jgi:hypothetical protein